MAKKAEADAIWPCPIFLFWLGKRKFCTPLLSGVEDDFWWRVNEV
jgi:hypothetical protein